MMNFSRLACVVTVASSLIGASALRADQNPSMIRVNADEVKWSQSGMPGIQVAVLSGDPKKEGLYVVRVKFAPHSMSRPHYHPETRYVTVIKGTWWTGTGDKFDPETTVPLAAGSLGIHEPGLHHYDGAKDEEVIVQIMGMGPSGTIYINPSDEPRKRD